MGREKRLIVSNIENSNRDIRTRNLHKIMIRNNLYEDSVTRKKVHMLNDIWYGETIKNKLIKPLNNYYKNREMNFMTFYSKKWERGSKNIIDWMVLIKTIKKRIKEVLREINCIFVIQIEIYRESKYKEIIRPHVHALLIKMNRKGRKLIMKRKIKGKEIIRISMDKIRSLENSLGYILRPCDSFVEKKNNIWKYDKEIGKAVKIEWEEKRRVFYPLRVYMVKRIYGKENGIVNRKWKDIIGFNGKIMKKIKKNIWKVI